MPASAAIITVGNEVLEGSTTDTNSGWLCHEVNGRGGTVVQILTVPDQRNRVIAALEQSFALGVGLVITTGGLGPTRDDLTAAAIAGFAGVPLLPDVAAARMVDRRLEKLIATGSLADSDSVETSASRTKMTLLPKGAEPIPNEVGVAPAIHLAVAGGGILALPGVPGELKHIVSRCSGHVFERWLGVGHLRRATITTSTNDESVLDGALRWFDDLGIENVYLKSRARRFGPDVRVVVTLSARGTDLDTVEGLLEFSLTMFRRALDARDIDVTDVSSDQTQSKVVTPNPARRVRGLV